MMLLAPRPAPSLPLSPLQVPGVLFHPPHPLSRAPPSHSTSNLAMQVEDVLVHIFRMLDLDDLHAMRLVNKRLCVLVSAKVVWVELLQRLALPIPASSDIASLCARDIERLAVRAVRLEANWSSPAPTPTRMWSLPVDSVVVVMAMCRGVLFTAHKDGLLRCWRDLSPDAPSSFQSDREDPRRVDTLVPEARIVKFSLLQVCLDPSDSHFVVAYAGDSIDRRTYCGVFRVPVRRQRHSDQDTPLPPAVGQLFEETKGIVSVSVSPTSLSLVHAQGNVSVIDFATRNTYTVDLEALRARGGSPPPSSGKTLKVQTLPHDHLLVLTTDAMAVYPMPTALQPHVDTPVFLRDVPGRCATGWVQVSEQDPLEAQSPSSSASSRVVATVTILRDDKMVERHSLMLSPESGWDLESDRPPLEFPHPVNRLTLTEMHGGRRRSAWAHLQRGSEGWSVHVVGANNTASSPSTPSSTTFTNMADVDADRPDTGAGVVGERVRSFTRVNSLPRLCFDEGSGKMVLAGMCEAKVSVLDYA